LIQALWQETEVTVLRASHTGADGFDLIIRAEHADSLWNAILDAGAQPVGYSTLELLRIEAGIPRYGSDMDETNVVPETALDNAVSYTKGCYVGQEIIARIKYRGHVAKRLSGFAFEGTVQVSSGSKITSLDGKEIGRVTSIAFSPSLSRSVALGYVKYDYLTPGTKVQVEFEDETVEATVVELPFIKVSSGSKGGAG
jgi:folate-binding protein YgfZ